MDLEIHFKIFSKFLSKRRRLLLNFALFSNTHVLHKQSLFYHTQYTHYIIIYNIILVTVNILNVYEYHDKYYLTNCTCIYTVQELMAFL